MRPAGPHKEVLRKTRFEFFEPRIVLSAQSPADFYLDYLSAGPYASCGHDAWREVQQQLSDAHDQTGLTDARRSYGFTGSGQTVVVIDSGIAYDHPALGGGFGGNYQVVGGWDFTEENDADPYDDGSAGSHGTHVAGIIGSNDVVNPGVAPGVDLVALRVFNDFGAGYFEWVEDALQWVHENRDTFDNPITAVNLSLGADWNSDSVPSWAIMEDEFAQLEADGIFIGVAAGNSFLTYGEPGLGYPAASPFVVPVASLDDDGDLSYFSQRNERVIAAPGRSIVSTVPDYAGDNNGVSDDFASYSGTSMATPYVTGASVLIREALLFVGETDITQDRIYDIMRQTGDSVWDTSTSQYYTSLNLQAALDSIMPADDFGSTVASAHALGAVAGSMSVDGMIGQRDDVDYFRFTAGASGEARLTFQSTDGATPVWISGPGVSDTAVDGNHTLSFDVVAGDEYVVGLATNSPLAHYQLGVGVASALPMLDWGTIAFAQFSDLNLRDGETWYQFTAARDGLVSVQASFARAGGDVHLEIYNSDHVLVAHSDGENGSERIDVSARAGETFFLKAVGRNDEVDFQVTNLVRVERDTVSVFGTSRDDLFTFAAGSTMSVSVNGVDYSFDRSEDRIARFYGNAGTDEVILKGAAAPDQAVLRADYVRLTGSGYESSATGVETVHVHGGGGADKLLFYDSVGDDLLTLRPGSTELTGDGYRYVAEDFETVYAFATAGGHDEVVFYDSSAGDVFVASPGWARMAGAGFYNYASGFEQATAYATAGGEADSAVFYDSAGDDYFTADPDSASMTGEGFSNQAFGFNRYYGYATAGGDNDAAVLYDSAGDNLFVSRPAWARMDGDGVYSLAKGFETIRGYASAGSDRAVFYDSGGDDHFIAHADRAQLDGESFSNYAEGFAAVTAFATAGDDTAHYYDSAGDDRFVVNGVYSYMQGDGFFNLGRGFDRVYVHADQGGEDQIRLLNVHDSHYLYGRDGFAYLATDDVLVWLYGPDRVTAHAAPGQTPSSDVTAVDFVFKQVGQWSK